MLHGALGHEPQSLFELEFFVAKILHTQIGLQQNVPDKK